ncbi:hypothetical protein B0T26DRAFT_698345 [Lasiosphaeria miniovina]|uniref:Uncharacterized protein n=1 Tax=Lasiosphaeria miniovina TaxID=1954250 RepID=A0AA40B6C3_9PEZI|nr:uncharacterized protein B0T26DRAFT_698345 [Lasiosphaeria miniovina]KAK0728535.1 hypothetical protein B0T26DRAFT_698345 [Lasiosphaeria miniovina]
MEPTDWPVFVQKVPDLVRSIDPCFVPDDSLIAAGDRSLSKDAQESKPWPIDISSSPPIITEPLFETQAYHVVASTVPLPPIDTQVSCTQSSIWAAGFNESDIFSGRDSKTDSYDTPATSVSSPDFTSVAVSLKRKAPEEPLLSTPSPKRFAGSAATARDVSFSLLRTPDMALLDVFTTGFSDALFVGRRVLGETSPMTDAHLPPNATIQPVDFYHSSAHRL